MAKMGFNVNGVEIRDEVINSIKNEQAHFHEPGLHNTLKTVLRSNKLRVTKKIAKSKCTVYIITVGTPLNKDGISRMDMITSVVNDVAKVLKDNDLVILRSTVKIGVTRNVVLPILKKTKKNFSLAFCPERTLEGKALSELKTLPQIVGGLDEKSSFRCSQIFSRLTPTIVKVSSIETAEMIKLTDNAQRDVLFAYANEISRACEQVGINAVEVINSGKFGYPRTNLALPGPVGGPCLEKDSHILCESINTIELEITKSARLINERQPIEVAARIKKIYTSRKHEKFPRIVILGLAFKGYPETDDLRGTMAIPIANALKKEFNVEKIYGFDPVVNKINIENINLVPITDINKAFTKTDIVVIQNNHSYFQKLDIEKYVNLMSPNAIVYDFWNLFNKKELQLENNVKYVSLGDASI
jgi:nucleotide sugar dehydrogenase